MLSPSVVTTVLVASASLLATGSVGASAATTSRTHRMDAVRVAFLQPTGGYFAPHNALLGNGAAVAAGEIATQGRDGSVAIQLQRIRYRPRTSATEVIDDAATHGAHVVILPCNDDAVPKLAAAAAERGILALAPCNPAPKLLERYPSIWPVGMSGNEEVAQLVNYAVAQNGHTAFILTPSPTTWYASMLTPYFRKAAKLVHLRVVGDASVALDGSNVKAVSAAIAKARPTVILTDVFSPFLSRVVAALRANGVGENIPVYATDGADAKLDLPKYGPRLENVLVAAFGFARPDTSRQFFKDYRRTFGPPDPGSFGNLGYQTVQVLETALRRARSTRTAAIAAVFAKGMNVTGITLADIHYTGHGNHLPSTDAAIARVIRGQRMAIFSGVPAPMPKP